MEYLKIQYAANNEVSIYDKPTPKGRKIINKLLLGTWMGVVEENDDFYRVVTAGKDGWVKKVDSEDELHLKLFFVDVGQGDAVLCEIGEKRYIIDGGPNANFYNYLTKWQFTYLLNTGESVHFDGLFISHFDADHYACLIPLLLDTRFTFSTVYHNGIARFNSTKSKRPVEYDQDLGTTINHDSERFLKTSFSSIADLIALMAKGGLQPTFLNFAEAVVLAHQQGRIESLQSLTHEDDLVVNEIINEKAFSIKVLGPIKTMVESEKCFKWFEDSSHTRNGHSIVVKFTYGETTVLLGGDLNSASEEHLMNHYGSHNPFEVDVAKSCHHGSSDFTTAFMSRVNALATVISSGDNESYAHPRADAIGCAGKYSRSVRPKVYSTELARSINSSKKVMFGMINLRSDGKRIFMAQMKEVKTGADIWDSYYIS